MRPLLKTSLTVMTALTVVLGANSADAKKNKSCKKGKCPPVAEESLDPSAELLIGQLARHPELMNLEYLKYHIGRPENERGERYNLNRNYFWYDDHHQLRYHLEQNQSAPGQVVDATMSVRLDGMGVTFDKLESLFGPPAKKFFDYSGHPSELFTLAPNTFLSFSSPPNSFRLNQAKISYKGPPLPVPSEDHMATGESQLLARTQQSADTDLTTETVPLLQAAVKIKPFDPAAHLALAQALQKQCRLHEAIGEYKTALAMSTTNDNVRNQCLSALRSLHIIDDRPYEGGPRRDLKIIQHGQRMRASGKHNPGDDTY